MNDIQGYVEIVKREFKQYISNIFEGNENQALLDKVMEKYIEYRYFSLEQEVKDAVELRQFVLDNLKKEIGNLSKRYAQEDVNNIVEVFSYIMYLDNVGKASKVQKVIDDIMNFMEEKVQVSVSLDFPKTFLKIVNKYKQEKEEYIDRYNVEYFKLKVKKTDNEAVKMVSLTHNIDFPDAFSTKIVQQAFDTGITSEDKLLVEYHMVNVNILKDIIKGKFNSEYIVEFANSLLGKKGKLERVLKVISKDYLMEKVNLQIEHKNFTEETKSEIYDLMRQGYKIAIKLDETFVANEININKLDVFTYIVINEKLEFNEMLLKNKVVNKKILKV